MVFWVFDAKISLFGRMAGKFGNNFFTFKFYFLPKPSHLCAKFQNMRKFYLLAFLFLLGIGSVNITRAQVTNSSITGTVDQPNNEGLAGATVTATHLPSGTKYQTITSKDGTFVIQGMRPGGPYTIEISFVGYEPIKLENVFLSLGEPYVVKEKVSEQQQELTNIVVTSAARNPILNNRRTGAATNITSRQLEDLPTIKRSITDFTRLTPQANGNGFAGRDNRFNSVKVDGATFNNGFGLSSDLLPGGDAQPISLDAIEEVQVNIAPYDVRQSGFTGAAINAVTKSGTNKWSGSIYGLYRDQSFNGQKLNGKDLNDTAKTTNKVYGARLGGPIIKNKLFIFGNFEKSKYVYPGNTWVANRGQSGPNVSRTTAEDLDAVSSYLQSKYGYNPGRYENYANDYTNEDTKFLGRIDWNINTRNKFSIRYNQVVGTSDQATNFNSGPNPRSSSGRIGSESIAFEYANYSFKNIVRSLTAELNSSFSNRLSNQFLATYSYIESRRSTPGQLFPFVDIWEDGSNYMSFGTELFSYNNAVINNNYSFIDNLTYLSGKHTITTGLSMEIMDFKNSYVREGTSYYRYNSVSDFLNDAPPVSYAITYPYGSDTYAKANFAMGGIYGQDKIQLSPKLNLTVGLRIDVPFFLNDPLHNPTIDTLQLLDKNYKPTTYSTSTWPKTRLLLSPRVGFNYDVFGNRSLQLRGGTGIFTGLIPFVWFTNQPTNSGVLQNQFEPVNSATLAKIDHFSPDPYYWIKQLPSDFPTSPSTKAPGTVNLIDPDFKMPQIWRTNIGADYKIPSTPLVATFDFIYSKDINAVYQFNANRKPATATLNYAGDDREYWINKNNAVYNPATGSVVPVLSNTNKGRSMAATIGFSLPQRKGLFGSIFYTYTLAKDVSGNPGSSANSAWSNNYSVNDPNELLLGYSQYSIPHRVVGNVSYRVEYAGHLATTVSLFYQGSNAGRFAYTYSNDINMDGVSLDLLYVPASASELNFTDITNSDGTVQFTADQQRAAFEKFVNNSKALKDAKGQYVERNSGLLPWFNRFDFRLLQDIFTNIGKNRNTLQISVDILNVGNLLNSKWGVLQELNGGSNYNYGLLNVKSVSPEGVPTFNMITVKQPDGSIVLPENPYRDAFYPGNTWNMQIGLRYTF